MATSTNIPATLNWNTFTAAFGNYFTVGSLHFSQNMKKDVVPTFAEWINKFGYSAVRDMIVRYLNYCIEGACYWSANYDLIGYKPAYYDYKYIKAQVLMILDKEFSK